MSSEIISYLLQKAYYPSGLWQFNFKGNFKVLILRENSKWFQHFPARLLISTRSLSRSSLPAQYTENSVLSEPQTMILGFVYIGSTHQEINWFHSKFSDEINYAFAHQVGENTFLWETKKDNAGGRREFVLFDQGDKFKQLRP